VRDARFEVGALLFEGGDLGGELLDDCLVLGNVEGNVDDVAAQLGADVLGAVGVDEGVARLFEVDGCGRDVGDHDCLGIAA